MKKVVMNCNPCTIKMESVGNSQIVGGINIINCTRFFIHRRSDGKYSPVQMDFTNIGMPTYWDYRTHDSVKDMLECYKHNPEIEWYVFDTRRELLEWLLK